MTSSANDGPAIGVIGAGNPDTGTSRGDQLARLVPVAGGRVVAFCDLKEENARRAAHRVAGATAFTDLDQFLDSGIDAAIICTPVGVHVDQAVQCFQAGVHVLSEVPAAETVDGARRLAEAAAHSDSIYMLAENYVYYDEVLLVKRMIEDGLFGELYFGEGHYLLDCKGLWRTSDGTLTWRGRGYSTIYCTHPLGPVLYLLQDRVTSVSCLATPSQLYDPEVHWLGNHVMLMRTANDRTLRLRVDHISSRPRHIGIALQGTSGAYESSNLPDGAREARVWLGHERRHRRWGPLLDFAERYIPERLAAATPADAHREKDFWMLRDFIDCLKQGRRPEIDVNVGLDFTLPGIIGAESARRGGIQMPVPNPRDWTT